MLRFLLLLGVLCASSSASAHRGSVKYLYVEDAASSVRVVVDLDPIDVAAELGVPRPETWPAEQADARRGEIEAWATEAIRVSAEGSLCRSKPESLSWAEHDGARWIRVVIAYSCASAERRLLRDDAVFDDDPQHEAFVRIGTDENSEVVVLRASYREIAIGRSSSATEVIARFIVEGARHLLSGYDHMLFLLALLLAAGPIAARSGWKAGARNVAWVVTGFTVGHSITLALAATDVVRLPSRWVESGIAASIVVVALANVFRPEGYRGRAGVAAAFGLLHGFGFSSVLRELVLPLGDRALAFASFNLGIELAQLGLVVLAIGPLTWSARRTWYRNAVMRVGSFGIAIAGAVWLVQRLAA